MYTKEKAKLNCGFAVIHPQQSEFYKRVGRNITIPH
jgi:hypothetical protein